MVTGSYTPSSEMDKEGLLKKEVMHKERKQFILLMGLLTLGYALVMPDRADLVQNFLAILRHPAYLLTDFLAVGGLSATFFNVACHFFLAYFLMSRNASSLVSGLQIGAVGLFAGHAFFGTTLLNSLPLIMGVWLYSHYTQQSFKLYTTISLFTTGIAPIISYLATQDKFGGFSIPFALAVGLFLGFIAPLLAEEFLKFHRGLTLYNYGFTTGMIAFFFVLLLPYLSLSVESRSLVGQGYHEYLLIYLLLLLVALLVCLVPSFSRAVKEYPRLLKSTGRVPDDFVSKFGLPVVLLNVLIQLVLYLGLVLWMGVILNGPVLGGLLTLMGFSAFGKHPRNTLPIVLGIGLAAVGLGHSLQDLRVVLAILFGTGLSPIAGFYGLGYGVLAGFFHYNLSGAIFGLHQGLGLYNNGFATGFVAAFLAPIIDTIQEHQLLKRKGNVK